jgi:hypothetical protein
MVIRDACILSKTISALRIVAAGESDPATGIFTQLSCNSVIRVCGVGFNDRTVKLQSGPSCYFVFKEDIAAAEITAAALRRNTAIHN